MMDAGAASPWKAIVFSQLQERNTIQSGHFRDLIKRRKAAPLHIMILLAIIIIFFFFFAKINWAFTVLPENASMREIRLLREKNVGLEKDIMHLKQSLSELKRNSTEERYSPPPTNFMNCAHAFALYFHLSPVLLFCFREHFSFASTSTCLARAGTNDTYGFLHLCVVLSVKFFILQELCRLAACATGTHRKL